MTQDPPEDAADPRGAHDAEPDPPDAPDAEPDPPDAPDAEPDPPDAPDAEAGETFDAEERESVKRVEAGGIPVAAERRLRELGEGAGAFTSDLEVSDFALCHQLGLRPLAQVMGSSIYQVGYQGMEWGSMWGGGYGARYGRGIRTGMGGRQMFELQVLSEAWNEARRRALNRLAEEAGHVGADAVVGVDLNTGAHDWAENSIEYMVVGTAVRRGDGRRPGGGNGAARGAPVLTELTLADYANLDRAGIEALGIVAWSSVFFVAASYNTQAMSGGLGGLSIAGFENQELPEFTQGIYSARESVISQMTAQAQQLSASGVIGTRIDHGIKRIEGDGERNRPPGLIATFHAIGTAIRERGGVPLYPPETTVSLTT